MCLRTLTSHILIVGFVAGCSGGSGGGGGPTGSKPTSAPTGSIWCTKEDNQSVIQANLPSSTPAWETDLKDTPLDIARIGDDLWVTLKSAKIARLDAKTGAIKATFPAGAAPTRIAARNGQLWAIDYGSGGPRPYVMKVDTTLNKIALNIPVGDISLYYEALHFLDDNTLLLMIGNEFGLAKINATTGAVLGHLKFGEGGGYGYGELAIDGSTGWIIDDYQGKLFSVDISTMAVTGPRLALAEKSFGDAHFKNGHVYASSLTTGNIVKIRTSDGTMVGNFDSGLKAGINQLLRIGDVLYAAFNYKAYGKMGFFDLTSDSFSETSEAGLYADRCTP